MFKHGSMFVRLAILVVLTVPAFAQDLPNSG